MTRLCIDTSAYSHFMRGEPSVVAHLDRASWVGVPSIVLGELWTGFLLGDRADENAAELDAFLAHDVVKELSVDAEVARIYAEVVVDLRRAATPLPTNDIWIAACAVRAGSTVISFDGHFSQIGRVGSILL